MLDLRPSVRALCGLWHDQTRRESCCAPRRMELSVRPSPSTPSCTASAPRCASATHSAAATHCHACAPATQPVFLDAGVARHKRLSLCHTCSIPLTRLTHGASSPLAVVSTHSRDAAVLGNQTSACTSTNWRYVYRICFCVAAHSLVYDKQEHRLQHLC